MKIVSTLLSLILVTSFVAVSQNKSFPEDCKPKEVAASEAAVVAKSMIPTCGFGGAYFAKKDLEDLMDVKGCVGVRFYIAMERTDQRYADIIAVAINAYGKEIGDFLSRKYHMAKPLDAFFPSDFQKMDRFKAQGYVNQLIEGKEKLIPYVSYLGVSGINSLLNTASAVGIRIYPSELIRDEKPYRTMSFGAVRVNGNIVEDASSFYLQGSLPCPTDCGGNDDKYYLWNR